MSFDFLQQKYLKYNLQYLFYLLKKHRLFLNQYEYPSFTSKNKSLPTGDELGCPIPLPFNIEYTIRSAPVENNEIPLPPVCEEYKPHQSSLISSLVFETF